AVVGARRRLAVGVEHVPEGRGVVGREGWVIRVEGVEQPRAGRRGNAGAGDRPEALVLVLALDCVGLAVGVAAVPGALAAGGEGPERQVNQATLHTASGRLREPYLRVCWKRLAFVSQGARPVKLRKIAIESVRRDRPVSE